MIDWQTIIRHLSFNRPIFHSEADFQHALAWKIHQMHPQAQVRLEYRPIATERMHVDVWLEWPEMVVAVELKYLTRQIRAQVNDEEFNLSNQAAQDIRRYDFVSDLVRLEKICNAGRASVGYAILLTNDQAHWRQSSGVTTADSAFRIHEGRVLSGMASWSEHASLGTRRGRESSLTLFGSYPLRWRDYSQVARSPGGQFRYLFVKVIPATTLAK